ncbi:hypothetical protein SAMN06265222_101235 [Neorhodopirellula lusitana]|uniref:Uncharacterized protein n=1 Tax=Neorhodopirellula lusitana TaxID=445327 RepID=A0ABY1PPI7_9BACT|nr:hypothetical protein [Neorhodopirellula lusitana]SMP39020.1 hypothetical protein SAMN06265222_101235 [Neorhodopirellula lusitana]
MSRLFFGMILGAGLMYGAIHYHVVRGDDGVFLVPKVTNELHDVYVDIRGFTLEDWRTHKPLAAAIMKSDKSELLSDTTLGGMKDGLHSVVDRLFSEGT